MAKGIYPPEVLDALGVNGVLHLGAILMGCWVMTVVFMGYTIKRVFEYEGRSDNPVFRPYMLPFALGCIILGLDIIPTLIIYFGLPRFLTFGVQVGKILPASCEASMPVEGPNGTPCYCKRWRELTLMYLRGQDGRDKEELSSMWRRIWIPITILVLLSVASVLLLKYAFRRDQAKASARANEEEYGKEAMKLGQC